MKIPRWHKTKTFKTWPVTQLYCNLLCKLLPFTKTTEAKWLYYLCNLYANFINYNPNWFSKKTLKPKSRPRKWNPAFLDEIKLFIGIVILTGLMKMVSFTHQPSVASCQSDRFMIIKRCWHFNNNQAPGYDPQGEYRDCLHKICPLVNSLLGTITESIIPAQWLTVDESLIVLWMLVLLTVYTK